MANFGGGARNDWVGACVDTIWFTSRIEPGLGSYLYFTFASGRMDNEDFMVKSGGWMCIDPCGLLNIVRWVAGKAEAHQIQQYEPQSPVEPLGILHISWYHGSLHDINGGPSKCQAYNDHPCDQGQLQQHHDADSYADGLRSDAHYIIQNPRAGSQERNEPVFGISGSTTPAGSIWWYAHGMSHDTCCLEPQTG